MERIGIGIKVIYGDFPMSGTIAQLIGTRTQKVMFLIDALHTAEQIREHTMNADERTKVIAGIKEIKELLLILNGTVN